MIRKPMQIDAPKFGSFLTRTVPQEQCDYCGSGNNCGRLCVDCKAEWDEGDLGRCPDCKTYYLASENAMGLPGHNCDCYGGKELGDYCPEQDARNEREAREEANQLARRDRTQ